MHKASKRKFHRLLDSSVRMHQSLDVSCLPFGLPIQLFFMCFSDLEKDQVFLTAACWTAIYAWPQVTFAFLHLYFSSVCKRNMSIERFRKHVACWVMVVSLHVCLCPCYIDSIGRKRQQKKGGKGIQNYPLRAPCCYNNEWWKMLWVMHGGRNRDRCTHT